MVESDSPQRPCSDGIAKRDKRIVSGVVNERKEENTLGASEMARFHQHGPLSLCPSGRQAEPACGGVAGLAGLASSLSNLKENQDGLMCL